MIRKRLLSAYLALALCLNLLPATALAADGVTLRIGNTTITESGYWTTSNGGNTFTYVNGAPSSGGYIHYVPNATGGPTLTLNNVTIAGTYDASNNIEGTGIYMSSSSGSASLTIMLQGDNNQVSGASGIYVFSDYGDASLSISGTGSLTAKGTDYGNHSGIMVQSNGGKAELTINNVDVTATNSNTQGIRLQPAGTSPATLAVNGGSLTASGSKGIDYQFGTGATGSGTPTVTVSNNAIVRANGSISNNSSTEIHIGADSSASSGGIVFDGNEGTVYGSVTLEENLTIGEGESLDIPSGASLTIDSGATLTNEGTVTNSGTLTNNGTIDNSGTLPDNINGNGTVNHAPTITTDSLPNGTEGTSYSQTLTATGTAPITWSIAEDSSLPAGLSLGADTGVISGIPTADGTFNFTVTATNAYGSDSKEFTLTIDQQGTIHVTSVSLDKTSLELTEGGTDTLTATITPNNATNKNVTWSTSNASIATVNNGEVTAVSAGTATITATADGKSATCTVTVTAATVPVTGVTMNKTSTSLYVGDTETLTATVAPDNATNKAVTWTSSDSAVATVDQNGVVTAVAHGTATITVTTEDGNYTATCTVTVSRYSTGGGPTTYAVTAPDVENGTVRVSPSRASRGTTVTITVTPDEGYELESLTVLDSRDNEIALTDKGDGKYTFTMPSGKVTVEASFAEIAPEPLPFGDVDDGDWFADAVRFVYENGMMNGVSETDFAPHATTSRSMIVTILYRLEGEPVVDYAMDFTDVAGDAYYAEAVRWAASEGIVGGYGGGLFGAEDAVAREQLAVILYRYAVYKGYDVSIGEDTNILSYADFADLSEYAIPAMQWACGAGIVNGTSESTLTPQGEATRAQVAAMLMRFCESIVQ